LARKQVFEMRIHDEFKRLKNQDIEEEISKLNTKFFTLKEISSWNLKDSLGIVESDD